MRHFGTAIALALSTAQLAGPRAEALEQRRRSGEREMDFSHVTSRARADELVKRGELVKIWMFPRRFGGPRERMNVGYVPAGTEVALNFAHDRISGLIELGSIDGMTIEPQYRGKSVVLSAITYICKSTRPGTGEIKISIDIW